MDTRETINLIREGLSQDEVEETCLEKSPEERKAYSQGFLLGIRYDAYLREILEGKGLTECRDEIESGLIERLFHRIPDNPHKHPEIPQLFSEETKDYVDKWGMYEQLFREAA